MKYGLNTQNGFSLLSVVVSIAVVGALILAVLGIAQNSSAIQAQAEAHAEVHNQIYLARLALADVRTCTLNFGGRDLTSPQRNLAIPRYRQVGQDTLGSDLIFPDRNQVSSVKVYVENVSIEMDARNPMAARLTLEFGRPGMTNPMIRFFPMAVELDAANRIVSCSAGDVNFPPTRPTASGSSRGSCDPSSDSSGPERRAFLGRVCSQLSFPTSTNPIVSHVPADYGIDRVFFRGNMNHSNNTIRLSSVFSNIQSQAECLALPEFPEGSALSTGGSSRVICINGNWIETSSAQSGSPSQDGGAE